MKPPPPLKTPLKCLDDFECAPACIAPPALPCYPNCAGWMVVTGPGPWLDFNQRCYLQPCPACDHWPVTEEGAMAMLDHIEACRACADRAIMCGAFEPIYRLFEGISFTEVAFGWTASVTVHGRPLVTTAVYPARADAREAGMAWLRRLRGEP